MNILTQGKWDVRFLKLAHEVASWSKDPSTKVGCVLVKGKKVVSVGYNGLPMGIEDSIERLTDRELKYEMTVHAEVNAVTTAALHGVSTSAALRTSLSIHAVAALLYLLTLVSLPWLFQPTTSTAIGGSTASDCRITSQ